MEGRNDGPMDLQDRQLKPVLKVRDLVAEFPARRRGMLAAVSGVSFDVFSGERLAIVGESGSGKSMTALSIMGLVPTPGRARATELRLGERDLLTSSARDMSKVRGGEIGLIFQDPTGALNPLRTIGAQIRETLLLHEDLPADAADERVLDLLHSVGMAHPELRVGQYPHELSGGMNQRAMIASALAGTPSLLLADEPTTALDATTAAGVLELLKHLSSTRQMAVMLITHDLGVVAGFADRVLIMYAGRLVEQGPVEQVFYAPRHPYTQGLLSSVPGYAGRRRLSGIPGNVPGLGELPSGCAFHPRCSLSGGRVICSTDSPELRSPGDAPGRLSACHFAEEMDQHVSVEESDVTHQSDVAADDGTLLTVKDLSKVFELRATMSHRQRRQIRAVNGVSFSVRRGETVALVGESGSGKTTTARMVLGLLPPTGGTVDFLGTDMASLGRESSRTVRKRLQVVFQNSDGALDPRMRVIDVVTEPLVAHGRLAQSAKEQKATELLGLVGLKPADLSKYSTQFSGGQKQRIGIARALASDPDLVVCDEPVTALDASVQAQILNLLDEIKHTRGISYLLIAHDLAVVKHMADRILVMYLGNIVEEAPAAEFFEAPHHPYSLALISASPSPDPLVERRRERIILLGTLPSPADPPPGCSFHTRCWKATSLCTEVAPPLVEISHGRRVACHFPEGGADAPARGVRSEVAET